MFLRILEEHSWKIVFQPPRTWQGLCELVDGIDVHLFRNPWASPLPFHWNFWVQHFWMKHDPPIHSIYTPI